jgi:hypothetical protein
VQKQKPREIPRPEDASEWKDLCPRQEVKTMKEKGISNASEMQHNASGPGNWCLRSHEEVEIWC